MTAYVSSSNVNKFSLEIQKLQRCILYAKLLQ